MVAFLVQTLPWGVLAWLSDGMNRWLFVDQQNGLLEWLVHGRRLTRTRRNELLECI